MEYKNCCTFVVIQILLMLDFVECKNSSSLVTVKEVFNKTSPHAFVSKSNAVFPFDENDVDNFSSSTSNLNDGEEASSDDIYNFLLPASNTINRNPSSNYPSPQPDGRWPQIDSNRYPNPQTSLYPNPQKNIYPGSVPTNSDPFSNNQGFYTANGFQSNTYPPEAVPSGSRPGQQSGFDSNDNFGGGFLNPGSSRDSLSFDVLERGQNFEHRRYPASNWACTQVDTNQNKQNSPDFQNSPAFFNSNPRNPSNSFRNTRQFASGGGEQPYAQALTKVKQFFDGANSDRTTIEIMGPVTIKHVLTARFSRFDPETQEICFWLGNVFQFRRTPRPTDPDVYVQERNAVEFFVRQVSPGLSVQQFGGQNSFQRDLSGEARNFISELSRRNDLDNSGTYYVADYSQSSEKRPNEIWIPRKQQLPSEGGQFGIGQPQTGFGQSRPQVGQGQNAFNQGQPGFGIGQPGFSQGQSSFGAGQAGFGTGQPGFNQGQPGFSPGRPGFGQGQPGFGIGQAAFGQGQPGFGQSGLGSGDDSFFGANPNSNPDSNDFLPGTGIETMEERLEMIPYDVVRSNSNSYETRRYPASRWICTRSESLGPSSDLMNNWQRIFNNNPQAAISSVYFQESSSQKMMKKLQKYLFGLNTAGIEVNQTMPVVTKHVSDRRRSEVTLDEMCIWPGSIWERQQLPQPILPDVYVQNKPQFTVYARRFGGFALSANDFKPELDQLRSDLGGRNIDRNMYYTVTYNNPWTPIRRRNEVWVEMLL